MFPINLDHIMPRIVVISIKMRTNDRFVLQ